MNPSMPYPPEALRCPPRCAVSRIIQAAMLVAAWMGSCGPAAGWVLTINAGPKAAFLQVGIGSYSGVYVSGGTPLNNAQVNVVSVTVPANAVGGGIAQAMTSNSTQSTSFYDNFLVCNPPSQVYIGGWVRTPTGTGTGVLSVASPANLTSGANTIPFSQISWTSTANGNTTPDIPAGAFNGGTLALRNIAAGTWVENCHTFSYANTAVVAAGTYTGRVTYTLVLP
jgi:hypothetical protein